MADRKCDNEFRSNRRRLSRHIHRLHRNNPNHHCLPARNDLHRSRRCPHCPRVKNESISSICLHKARQCGHIRGVSIAPITHQKIRTKVSSFESHFYVGVVENRSVHPTLPTRHYIQYFRVRTAHSLHVQLRFRSFPASGPPGDSIFTWVQSIAPIVRKKLAIRKKSRNRKKKNITTNPITIHRSSINIHFTYRQLHFPIPVASPASGRIAAAIRRLRSRRDGR